MDTSCDSLETVIGASPKSCNMEEAIRQSKTEQAHQRTSQIEDQAGGGLEGRTGPAGTGDGAVSLKDSRRAWLVCFAAFTIQVLIVGVLHAFGVFFVAFLTEFETTKGTAAWVGSVAYGLTMLFGPLTSAAITRVGPRVTTMVGSAVCAASLFISSFVTSISAMFATFSLLYGIGTSLAYTPTMCIAVDYFDKYITVATGIMVAGSSTGTLVLSPLSQAMIDGFGWRNAFRMLSLMTLAGVWCGWQFKPLPGSAPAQTTSQKIRRSPARRLMAELHLWKNRVYVIWVMGITMVMFGYYIPYVHLVYHAEMLGIPPSRGSIIMMTLGGATATGRIMFGKIVQYGFLNRLHMHQLSMVVTGMAVMLLPLIQSFGGLLAYVICVGLVDGCYVVLLPTLTCTLAGAENMVLAWGGLVGVSSITYTLGPPVAGWLFDATGSYNLAFHVAGVPIICGALFLFFIPWAQRTGNSTNAMLAAKSYEVIADVPSDEEQIMAVPDAQGAFRMSQLQFSGFQSSPEEIYERPKVTHDTNSQEDFVFVSLPENTTFPKCPSNGTSLRSATSPRSITSNGIPEDVQTTIRALKKQSAQMVQLERLHDGITSPPGSGAGSIQSGYLSQHSQQLSASNTSGYEDGRSLSSARESSCSGSFHSHPVTSSVAIPVTSSVAITVPISPLAGSLTSSRRSSTQEVMFPKSVLSGEDHLPHELGELVQIFANDSEADSVSGTLALSPPPMSFQCDPPHLSGSQRLDPVLQTPLSATDWPVQGVTSPGLGSPRDGYHFPQITSNPSLPPLMEQPALTHHLHLSGHAAFLSPPIPPARFPPDLTPSGTSSGSMESPVPVRNRTISGGGQSPQLSHGSLSGTDGDIFHMSDINVSHNED